MDALALLLLQAALPPARVARAARSQVLLGHDELAALGLHASVLAELGGNPIDDLLGLRLEIAIVLASTFINSEIEQLS